MDWNKLKKLAAFNRQDITFCMSETCPIKQYCHRAIGHKERFFSATDFSVHCNANNVFEMFMQADKEDMKNYKEKKKC